MAGDNSQTGCKKANLNPVELQAADLSPDSHVCYRPLIRATVLVSDRWMLIRVKVRGGTAASSAPCLLNRVREKLHERSLDLCMVIDKRMA